MLKRQFGIKKRATFTGNSLCYFNMNFRKNFV